MSSESQQASDLESSDKFQKNFLETELKQISRFFENFRQTNEQISILELEKRELYTKIDSLEEKIDSEYSKNIDLERRNAELSKIIEEFQSQKLVDEGDFRQQIASNLVQIGVFNPSKNDLSMDDISIGMKVIFSNSIFSKF